MIDGHARVSTDGRSIDAPVEALRASRRQRRAKARLVWSRRRELIVPTQERDAQSRSIGSPFARRRSALVFLWLAAACGAGAAEPAAPLCGGAGTGEPRPAPAALAPALRRAFDLGADFSGEGAFFRCLGGRPLLCVEGPGRSCAKADKSWASPGANQWCAQKPPHSLVPVAATGRHTVYAWRCFGRIARPAEAIAPLDAHGYFKASWKPLR